MRVVTNHNIQASPETVWQVLADLDSWNEWNPFIIEAAGDVVEGSNLALTMIDPKGRRSSFKPVVDVADQPRRLQWTGKLFGLPGLFTGRHWFHLTELEQDGLVSTQLEHGEEFSGLLVRVLSPMLKHLPESFANVNSALGDRAMNAATC